MADSNDHGYNSTGKFVTYLYGIKSGDHRVPWLEEMVKLFWVQGAEGKPWYWWLGAALAGGMSSR